MIKIAELINSSPEEANDFEKVAAVDELMGYGYDFDIACDLVKEAALLNLAKNLGRGVIPNATSAFRPKAIGPIGSLANARGVGRDIALSKAPTNAVSSPIKNAINKNYDKKIAPKSLEFRASRQVM